MMSTTSNMIVHPGKSFNAEPLPARLASNFITAQSDFYVRCHGTIPHVEVDEFRLKIVVPTETLELSIADLRSRFPERSVIAVMQCAGNRRADMAEVKPVSGDPWGVGATSNAQWTGVGLGDVLKAAGVREDARLHVAFSCLDEIAESDEGANHFSYGVSIPLAKATAPETILAFEMNGEPLSVEHGFPVRLVTPGYAGARSPKWLASITVQDHPSDNWMQQKEYKLFTPDVTKETADYGKGATINEMPLNSAILEPSDGAMLSAGAVAMRGYAISTGRPVTAVEVSGDGGQTWIEADLERHPDAPWSWTPWSSTIELQKGDRELLVRAWDDLGETQPRTTAEIWNFPGYLSTAWHRITVHVA